MLETLNGPPAGSPPRRWRRSNQRRGAAPAVVSPTDASPPRTEPASAPRSPRPRPPSCQCRLGQSRPIAPGSRHVPCSRRPVQHDPSRWHPTPPPAGSDSHTPTRPRACECSSSQHPKAPAALPAVNRDRPHGLPCKRCAGLGSFGVRGGTSDGAVGGLSYHRISIRDQGRWRRAMS
jgi:hypothetical protein